ncbi:hypothetical protein DID75_01425 [Candidatus Marinamargulisbacteria bacterium SCGC AG-410-N11]|nr:hypothetical protein DID75_01425 [Candidatus Marinamargulisbacteria bacterium SCGC AG-410-N11]
MFNQQRYILRLDDACPTSNWKSWELIETICDSSGIKPLVGVIPNNKSKNLIFQPPITGFWSQVRAWQHKGWTIGLHGYDHTISTKQGGLVPVHLKSEFAGLNIDQQKEKILNGTAIFKRHKINTTIFIAPANSFDQVTCDVLSRYTTIRMINAGISYYPFKRYNLVWIPYQLSQFSKKKFGVWTFTINPNIMTTSQIEMLSDFCHLYAHQFVSDIDDLFHQYRNRSISWFDKRLESTFFKSNPPQLTN